MTTFVPSPQQSEIFRAVQDVNGGNLNIIAVAGAGKTTTILKAMEFMTGSVAFVAFNKAIANEISDRLKTSGSSHVAKTFHAFGLQSWSRVARAKIDDRKVYRIIDSLAPNGDAAKEHFESMVPFVKKIVSIAKQSGIGFLHSIDDKAVWFQISQHHDLEDDLPETATVEEAVSIATSVLKISFQQDKQIIDFDDMILAPLVHNAPVTKFDWVLIDEAQDVNATRRAFAKKMLRPGGRLIAVGDPRQAIYGFTGADADAMDIIAREFNSKDMPLTVTYRCPRSVVAFAQNWVSHIEAHPSAPEGEVRSIKLAEFHKITPGTTDAILCRNTKPIVELAYSLIRRGIPCNVEGRDIGRGLVALVNRWKVRSVEGLIDQLEVYREAQTSKMMAKGQEMAAQSLDDKVATLVVIAGQLRPDATVRELVAKIESLFTDTEPGKQNRVILSTIHKAKGREWDRVWYLGRNRYQPSPFARQEWQMGQEENLIYVAATRAKRELIEIEVPSKKDQQEA